MTINIAEEDVAEIKSDLRKIKEKQNPIFFGSFSITLIGLFFFSVGYGDEISSGRVPDIKDEWSVVSDHSQRVSEVILKHASGKRMDFRVTTLSRTWDLQNQQVCTEEIRKGMFWLLPHYAYTDMGCRSIAETDAASVRRAVQTLALAK